MAQAKAHRVHHLLHRQHAAVDGTVSSVVSLQWLRPLWRREDILFFNGPPQLRAGGNAESRSCSARTPSAGSCHVFLTCEHVNMVERNSVGIACKGSGLQPRCLALLMPFLRFTQVINTGGLRIEVLATSHVLGGHLMRGLWPRIPTSTT